MKRIRILCAMALVALTWTVAFSQECEKLRNTSAEEKVSYLEKIKGRADEDCIAYAIEWLGENKFEAGIPVLVKFLGFRRHPVGWEAVTSSTHTTIYPAASALERIGMSVLPAILDELKSDSAPRISREQAIEVWMVVHGMDSVSAVAELKRAADETHDLRTKQHLLSAVSAALKWCGAPNKPQCEEAARKNYR